jgi:chemotaxis protein methyltransferase CheR
LQITDKEFQLYKKFIEDKTGILLGDDKKYLIENRTSHMIESFGCSNFMDLYYKIKQFMNTELQTEFLDNITTKETFWFRNNTHFEIIEQVVLPILFQEINNRTKRKIRIWSAACATGQEPYSLAITILEYLRKLGISSAYNLEIIASDIAQSAIKRAKNGEYDNITIKRGLSSEFRDRYFIQDNSKWRINDKVKSMVKFQQLNLKDDISTLGKFDIVFIRNVIIYFGKEFKENLLDRITTILNPGGYLFMGAGETLFNLIVNYKILEKDGIIYYQKK